MSERITTLNTEFKIYIEQLKRKWLKQNRILSGVCYEVMNTEQRQEVEKIIENWVTYITPIAEKWWRDKGYKVIWPDDNSKPIKICKIKNNPSKSKNKRYKTKKTAV